MRHTTGTFRGAGSEELYFQMWSPEWPQAIVALVHGFGEHGGRYGHVADYLVQHGYAVAALDLRGHGRSPGPRGHINSWVEFRADVRIFLHKLRDQYPGKPLFLMGHSLGGLIVLEYTLHHPEGLTGVIASGPALGQIGISRLLQGLSRVLSRVSPRFSMDLPGAGTMLSRDRAMVEDHDADQLVHQRASARFGAEMLRAAAWTQERAARFAVPLLVIHGGSDRVVPPQSSRHFFERMTLPDKERREYPGTYHEPHNDINREQVLADLVSWLDRHVAGDRATGSGIGMSE